MQTADCRLQTVRRPLRIDPTSRYSTLASNLLPPAPPRHLCSFLNYFHRAAFSRRRQQPGTVANAGDALLGCNTSPLLHRQFHGPGLVVLGHPSDPTRQTRRPQALSRRVIGLKIEVGNSRIRWSLEEVLVRGQDTCLPWTCKLIRRRPQFWVNLLVIQNKDLRHTEFSQPGKGHC